jgi:hypothetical protein
MRELRKTKDPIFLIRSEEHVPSPLTMKTGRVHSAVSKSNTTADRQTYGSLQSRVDRLSQQQHKNIHKKNDSTKTKGTNNL